MNRFFTWEKTKHFLNISSIVMAVVLAPSTVLILLSQNSIPGELLYPYKRGLENTILAFASVSPATRVAFRTDLTERRSDEAEALLLTSKDATGFKEFVNEVKTTRVELNAIQDANEKKRLQEKFNASLDKYKEKLESMQSKLDAKGETSSVALVSSGNQSASQPQPTPTIFIPTNTPMPTNTPVPQPTTRPGQPVRPTNTPVPLPTNTPMPPTPTTIVFSTNTPVPLPTARPSERPRATNTSIPLPTATSIPTLMPTLQPTPVPPAPVYTRNPHQHPLDGVNQTAWADCMQIADIITSECEHHLPPSLQTPHNFQSEISPTPKAPEPTITPQPTATLQPTNTPTPTKENNRGGKVKGAMDTKNNDPFTELFNWMLTPFLSNSLTP